MAPANDTTCSTNIIQVRRTLQASLTKLMDVQDYLACQILALSTIEKQVRVLALRETSRSLKENSDPGGHRYLCELQDETNANFREMHNTYAELSAQIDRLMKQHEWLYAATFAQGGGTVPALKHKRLDTHQ